MSYSSDEEKIGEEIKIEKTETPNNLKLTVAFQFLPLPKISISRSVEKDAKTPTSFILLSQS